MAHGKRLKACLLLFNKPFLDILFSDSLNYFLNKLFSTLKGLYGFCSGYRAFRLIDKMVSLYPHPVKTGGKMLKIFPETIGTEFNYRFVLILSSRSISGSEHECPPSPEHGMISDRIRPLLIYFQIRLRGTQITLRPDQVRSYLPLTELNFLDKALRFKALQVHAQSRRP
jgi:hypothetical protein